MNTIKANLVVRIYADDQLVAEAESPHLFGETLNAILSIAEPDDDCAENCSTYEKRELVTLAAAPLPEPSAGVVACGCKTRSKWACAVQRGMTDRITCPCACHAKPATPEPPPAADDPYTGKLTALTLDEVLDLRPDITGADREEIKSGALLCELPAAESQGREAVEFNVGDRVRIKSGGYTSRPGVRDGDTSVVDGVTDDGFLLSVKDYAGESWNFYSFEVEHLAAPPTPPAESGADDRADLLAWFGAPHDKATDEERDDMARDWIAVCKALGFTEYAEPDDVLARARALATPPSAPEAVRVVDDDMRHRALHAYQAGQPSLYDFLLDNGKADYADKMIHAALTAALNPKEAGR